MTVLILLLLLLAWPTRARRTDVFAGWLLGQEIIPALLYERIPARTLLVGTFKTGYPPKERKFALVGANGTGSPWASFSFDPASESRSVVRDLQGTKERVHIAGSSLWIPYEVNPGAAAQLGCRVCQGVIYIGKASPIWSLTERLSFTAGNVVLNEYSRRWYSETGLSNGFECEVGHPDSLCLTQGEVNGQAVMVDWRLRRGETLLPESIYYDFLLDKHPVMSDADEFKDLVIKFTGPNTGPKSELRIPRRNIIAQHISHDNTLTILPWNGDSIVIGQDALLSVRFYRDLETNHGWVWPTYTKRSYSVQATIFLPLLILIFMRVLWGAPVPRIGHAFQEAYGRFVIFHILLDVVAVFAPVIALVNPDVWGVLADDWWPGAVFIGCGVFYFFYGVIGLIGLWAQAPERNEWYHTPDDNLPRTYRVGKHTEDQKRPHNHASFDAQLIGLQPAEVLGIVRQSIILRGSMLCGVVFACFMFAAETRPDYFSNLTLSLLAFLWFYSHASFLIIALRFSLVANSVGWLVYIGGATLSLLALFFTLLIYTLIPAVQYLYPERGVTYLFILINAVLAVFFIVFVLLRSPMETFLRMLRAQEF